MLHPMKAGTFRVSSGFGPRGGTVHRGIDYAAPTGTPFYAAEDGVVADARDGVGGFGCWIVIDHTINSRKVSTVYGHMYLSGVLVKKGQRVVRGQRIGLVGNNGQSTGPHLHFEVWVGGRLTGGTAVDPAPWLTAAPVAPTFPVLKYGSTGDPVWKFQRFMTSTFPSYNDYEPTGVFGTRTEAGLKEFQRRTGLDDDGVVGPLTLSMLVKYGFAI